MPDVRCAHAETKFECGGLAQSNALRHFRSRRSDADLQNRSAPRLFGGSQLAQLDHQADVGAGLVPALRKGTHEGCPYAFWPAGNGHAGDGKPSPY